MLAHRRITPKKVVISTKYEPPGSGTSAADAKQEGSPVRRASTPKRLAIAGLILAGLSGLPSALQWIGGVLLGVERVQAWTCRNAPGWTWLFYGMSCPEGPAHLYSEQRQKFLTAARDGDEPYLRHLGKSGFRIRQGDLCPIATELAGLWHVPKDALATVRAAVGPGASCSASYPVNGPGLQFTITTIVPPLDRALLDLPFKAKACTGEQASGTVPPHPSSAGPLIAMVHEAAGRSAEYREGLAFYRRVVKDVTGDPEGLFMRACMAEALKSPEAVQPEEWVILRAFATCPASSGEAAAKRPPAAKDQQAAQASCRARLAKWRADPRNAEPFGWHELFLKNLPG